MRATVPAEPLAEEDKDDGKRRPLEKVEMERITQVWSKVAPPCFDPEPGSEEERRMKRAQMELVSQWYVRSKDGLQRGIETCCMCANSSMATAEEGEEDEYSEGEEDEDVSF
jgi:hypothetical protein